MQYNALCISVLGTTVFIWLLNTVKVAFFQVFLKKLCPQRHFLKNETHGKQDNEIRAFTAALCICHWSHQFYTKYFRYFVMKLILPQIALIPQGAS